MFIVVNRGGFVQYGGEQFPAVIEAHKRIYETVADEDIQNYQVIEAEQLAIAAKRYPVLPARLHRIL